MSMFPVFTHVQDAAFPELALFTVKPVAPGTELTWNYGEDYWGEGKGGGRLPLRHVRESEGGRRRRGRRAGGGCVGNVGN